MIKEFRKYIGSYNNIFREYILKGNSRLVVIHNKSNITFRLFKDETVDGDHLSFAQ